MSIHKTEYDQSSASVFIAEHFHTKNTEIATLADGETSQAFAFEVEEGERVLRVNRLGKSGFLKDQLAHQKFSSSPIPIPEIIEIGTLDNGMAFAVSTRAEGKALSKHTTEEIKMLMPEIIKTLTAIHVLEPIGGGYGNWGLDGQGHSDSWRAELLANMSLDDEETMSADFYVDELHATLRARATELLDFCPEERRLIHNDFGFDNVISDGEKITGVIDWEHSAYGDPLKDIAWLDFWKEEQGYAATFRQYYEAKDELPDNFDERIKCYKLIIAMGALGFFARSRQQEKYEFARAVANRIKTIV